jgi:hypothetical protein
MKRLATEMTYLVNRVLFGMVFVPGILWSVNELQAHYMTSNSSASPGEYYLQFYSQPDNPVTWLWLASPYLLFLLTRRDGRSRIKKLQPSLSRTARKGHVEAMESPLAEGSNASAVPVRGQVTLQLAAMTDNVAIVHMLIDAGADVDAADPASGIRPLHISATNGCKNVCELLLMHGADIDAQIVQGDTALHLAAANRHSEAVSLLLRFHANHTVENHAGFTAEQVATAMGYDNIAELIRQYSKTN